MKTLLFLTFTLFLNVIYAQNDSILDCAIEANKKGMVYLKKFQTKLDPATNSKKGEKWPVVLNKGTKYRFYLCEKNNDKPEQVALWLFDDTHPESVPYASTTKKGHFYFECNKTGTYFVSIRYKDKSNKNEVSAVAVLLFVGKNK